MANEKIKKSKNLETNLIGENVQIISWLNTALDGKLGTIRGIFTSREDGKTRLKLVVEVESKLHDLYIHAVKIDRGIN